MDIDALDSEARCLLALCACCLCLRALSHSRSLSYSLSLLPSLPCAYSAKGLRASSLR
jgi:hypothetical protein